MDALHTRSLSTADLPVGMRVPVEVAHKPLTVHVLTCEHGPACPSCVLAAARVLIEADGSLTSLTEPLYTG